MIASDENTSFVNKKQTKTNHKNFGAFAPYADVAQLVEQSIRNRQVAGPSPAISSKNLPIFRHFFIFT